MFSPHGSRLFAFYAATFLLLPLNGCGGPESRAQQQPSDTVLVDTGDQKTRQEVVEKNLAKREQGEDWPHFLGPTRDSKSSEKGIVWPQDGPKIVWQRSLQITETNCSL